MKIPPVTDSEELKLTWAFVRLAAPGTVFETAKRNVPGRLDLDWWLECHPSGRSAAESDSVVFCLKVSAMPVKCIVKYTLGDIAGTREVMYSKMLDPYIFSIDKSALYAMKRIGGWTFKCEVTFTDVPSPVESIPNTVSPPQAPNDGPSMSRTFTDTIDLVIRPDDCPHMKVFEIYRRAISEDGNLFWSVLYCVDQQARNPCVKLYMQSSVSACTIVMTYEIAASKVLEVRQAKADNARPIGRCPCTLQRGKLHPINGEVVLRCTASFIFQKPIQVNKHPFGADICPKVFAIPMMRRPCDWALPPPILLSKLNPIIPSAAMMQQSPLVVFNGMIPVNCSAMIPFLVRQQRSPSIYPSTLPLQHPTTCKVHQEPLFLQLPKSLLHAFGRPILSGSHKSPCGVMWWVECVRDLSELRKSVVVNLYVSKKPIVVDVVFSLPEAGLTDRKIMSIDESEPIPKLLFKIDYEIIARLPVHEAIMVMFSFVFSTVKKDETGNGESSVESSHEVPRKRILTITDPCQSTVSGGTADPMSVADSASCRYDSKSSLTEYTVSSGSGVPSERSFDAIDINVSTQAFVQASADAIAAATCHENNNVLMDLRNHDPHSNETAAQAQLSCRLPSQNRKTLRVQPFPRYEDANFMFSQSSDEDGDSNVENIVTNQ